MLINSEKKEIKNLQKKLDKKVKAVEENEAKLKVEKIAFERNQRRENVFPSSRDIFCSQSITSTPQNSISSSFKMNMSTNEPPKVQPTQLLENENSGPLLISSPASKISSSAPTTSMISHWTPLLNNSFQNPGSIASMVTHCAKLPSPGGRLLSIEEVLEEMKRAFDKYFLSVKKN